MIVKFEGNRQIFNTGFQKSTSIKNALKYKTSKEGNNKQ